MSATKKERLELEEIVKDVPPNVVESWIMERDHSTVTSCLVSHSVSHNEFNRSWLINRMREISSNGTAFPQYIAGMMYADRIGDEELVREFKELLYENHPFIGRYFGFMTSMMLKVFNPYKHFL